MIVTASCTGFRMISQTSWGCVTLCCRLLVIVRLLRLVILVFEECLELPSGVLLFAVGCLLLCDRYIWSYWFSTLLVVHAFCTASDCGFLAVNWAVGGYMEENFPIFILFGALPSTWCSVLCRCAVSWVCMK